VRRRRFFDAGTARLLVSRASFLTRSHQKIDASIREIKTFVASALFHRWQSAAIFNKIASRIDRD
jgi:hypothetical protein